MFSIHLPRDLPKKDINFNEFKSILLNVHLQQQQQKHTDPTTNPSFEQIKNASVGTTSLSSFVCFHVAAYKFMVRGT